MSFQLPDLDELVAQAPAKYRQEVEQRPKQHAASLALFANLPPALVLNYLSVMDLNATGLSKRHIAPDFLFFVFAAMHEWISRSEYPIPDFLESFWTLPDDEVMHYAPDVGQIDLLQRVRALCIFAFHIYEIPERLQGLRAVISSALIMEEAKILKEVSVPEILEEIAAGIGDEMLEIETAQPSVRTDEDESLNCVDFHWGPLVPDDEPLDILPALPALQEGFFSPEARDKVIEEIFRSKGGQLMIEGLADA